MVFYWTLLVTHCFFFFPGSSHKIFVWKQTSFSMASVVRFTLNVWCVVSQRTSFKIGLLIYYFLTPVDQRWELRKSNSLLQACSMLFHCDTLTLSDRGRKFAFFFSSSLTIYIYIWLWVYIDYIYVFIFSFSLLKLFIHFKKKMTNYFLALYYFYTSDHWMSSVC